MLKQQKKLIVAVFLSFTVELAASQDFSGEFKMLRQKDDTTGQITLLKKWEAAKPQDAELFVAYFNFYAQKSMTDIISLDKAQKGAQSWSVKDSTTGKPVAFMNSIERYDSAILQKGFDYIDKGIALYPNRLDMRFGRIYMLGKLENYRLFADRIKLLVDYNANDTVKWVWKENKPLDDPKSFFLNTMQEYIVQLYNTGNDAELPLMREVGEAVLKYHPDHVECLADVALTYLIAADYDKALEYLLRAEQLAPKDVVILNNMAEAYRGKNDTLNAKIYYKKVIKFGDSDQAARAKEQMKKLD